LKLLGAMGFSDGSWPAFTFLSHQKIRQQLRWR
jgi:hypothetical protein